MRHPSAWAACLLAIGIAVGTLTDEVQEHAVPRAGDYWVLSGDFHVHAAPGDGTLLPWELRREARRAALDVIAITNHNQTFAARFGRWWSRRSDEASPIVLVGEEITSPGYHMAAVGLSHTVSRRQSAASAIEDVHAQGGVAIAAHPSRRYWPGFDDRALALLDGAEAANGTDPVEREDYAEFRRRAGRHNADIAAIGSSDFHGGPMLGRCRTYLLVRDRTDTGVLEAIRSGRTVAEDDTGALVGDLELVRLVEANRPAGRSDQHTWWRRLSLGFAWLGIVGLMLFHRAAP